MPAVRLYQVKDEYSERVCLVIKAYPLSLGEAQERYISGHSARGRAAAGEEAVTDGLHFRPWPQAMLLPISSIPALEAAKCASLQEEDRFQAYDLALFKAFFERCLNIGDIEVLIALARETGLEVDRFRRDLEGGAQRPLVTAEFMECLEKFGSYTRGIPLLSLNDGPPLVGCAPIEVYRRAVARQLDPLSA